MTGTENFVDRAEILPLLQNVKKDGEWVMAFCPVHADGTKHGGKDGRSLGLSNAGVLHCFAGCEFKDVIAALRGPNYRREDRAPDYLRKPTPIRRDAGERLVQVYSYTDEDGAVIAEKGRFETGNSKTFRWRLPGATGWPGLDGRNMNDLPLYGVARLQQRPDETVYFVEGEKATQACLDAGLLAVTAGGGAGQKDFGHALEPLSKREVVLWPDNDGPGRMYMNHLQALLQSLGVEVRWVNVAVPDKGDAADYFAAGGAVEGIEHFSPTEPMITVLADDSIEITIPTEAGKVTLRFEEMERTTRALDAALTVACKESGKYPYHQAINLNSHSARTELRRDLEGLYSKEYDWPKVLNISLALARDAYLRQDRGEDAYNIPEPIGDVLLVPPLVVADGPTILFGDGSSLKSYFSFKLAACVGLGEPFCGFRTPCLKVMVVDYEDSRGNFRRRMRRIMRGIDSALDDLLPEMLYYWPGKGIPLKDQVDAIRRKCEKEGIGLLIIDSAAPACGDDPSDPKATIALFTALKRIGLPVIIIAHINKGGDTQKPFGSVFWHNEARRTWYVDRAQEEDSDELDVALFCRKVNDGPKPSPLGFHVTFDGRDGPVRIELGSVDTVPQFLDQTSDRNRVWSALESGVRTIKDISQESGLDYKKIDNVLRRGPFVQAGSSTSTEKGRPAVLWARRTEREDAPLGLPLYHE